MISLILCYIVFGSILIIYYAMICPFLESPRYLQVAKNTYLPILIILTIRPYLCELIGRQTEISGELFER